MVIGAAGPADQAVGAARGLTSSALQAVPYGSRSRSEEGVDMEQRRLGTTGPMVSKFALGAMMFGGVANEKASREMLDTYIDAGGTFIDTADNYNNGTSERWIGQWLKDRSGMRERIVLATKGRFLLDGQPGASLSPDYLRTALAA